MNFLNFAKIDSFIENCDENMDKIQLKIESPKEKFLDNMIVKDCNQKADKNEEKIPEYT